MKNQIDELISYLGSGEEFAVSADQLRERTGLEDRTLRFVVQNLRRMGKPILSSSVGYYLPSEKTEEALREYRKFIHTMRLRGASSFEAASLMERHYRALNNQITLEQVDDFNTEDE